MAKKSDDEHADPAARGDTPQDAEKQRLMEENQNLRNDNNRLKEELEAQRHQGTPAPADDAGGKK